MSIETATAPVAQPEVVLQAGFTSTIHMAPPFYGWTGIRSPTPPGFWTAVRCDAGNGQIVMQLGGHGPVYYGRLVVGWKKRIQAAAGTPFRARFDARPITSRYTYNSVTLELTRVSDHRRFYQTLPVASFRQVRLEVEAPTSSAYDMAVYGTVLTYGGYQPYGEIIGHVSSVERVFQGPVIDPDGPTTLHPQSSTDTIDERRAQEEEAFALSERFAEHAVSDDDIRRGLIEFAG